MKIGIAFDLAPGVPLEGPDDRFEEFDKPETVEAIARVIRSEGHEVVLLGDGRDFLTRVLADPPDFVFNIAEGEGVGRCREARVPAVLEMLGIPCSGSDPLTMAASLDKSVARRLVESGSEVRVPQGLTLPPDIRAGGSLLNAYFHPNSPAQPPRPLILKPAFEGSSKGIRGRCVVDTWDQAYPRFEELIADYHQPILAEEYVEGDEVTVGILGNIRPGGNSGPTAIGVMRVMPKVPADRFVYSLEVKRDWRNQVDYEAPPLLADRLITEVAEAGLAVYRALGCRDLARIDFRLRDGIPYFIEANPLPGLAPVTSDLVILAKGHGISHGDLIRKILHVSLKRVGLS